jgi:hypothetical protein
LGQKAVKFLYLLEVIVTDDLREYAQVAEQLGV